jgi:hypothetical protein
MSKEQQDFVREHSDFLQHKTTNLFSEPQKSCAATVARHVIPSNDTPGADEANVALFIETMVQHWFSAAERKQFIEGLDDLIDINAQKFNHLNSQQQLSVLESLEDDASEAAWFDLGNTLRIWDSDAPFICQLKELVVLGFMLSEVGSTQFLKPNPMGMFAGSVTLKKEDSAHASQIPLRVLNKAVQ